MKLPELKRYLVREAEMDKEDVECMTPFELVKAYLHWNGIIGYTDDILDVVEAAYHVKLER